MLCASNVGRQCRHLSSQLLSLSLNPPSSEGRRRILERNWELALLVAVWRRMHFAQLMSTRVESLIR